MSELEHEIVEATEEKGAAEAMEAEKSAAAH